MNKRDFLLGIGAGLIMAALIIVLTGLFGNNAAQQAINNKTSPEPDTTQTLSDTSIKNNNNTKSGDNQSSETELKEIVILPGMTADDIAGLLKDENIIQDKNNFLNLINQQGAACNLKAGEFSLGSGWDNDRILSTLLEK